jgi:ribonuclease HII
MPGSMSLPRWPTLKLEREFGGRVCGVDEAGCAPIAGPVVAAAVVLPRGRKPRQLRGLTDSKLLSPEQRERFFDVIQRLAAVGVGVATVEEIDRLNIFHADMLAMKRAVDALDEPPDVAIVDGRAVPAVPCPATPIVKGDRRCLSIAAASVIAKVVRDRMMRELAIRWPGYGWETNVGYGTDAHYLGLLRLGPNEHHRRTFAPLTTIFGPDGPDLGRLKFRKPAKRPDYRRLEFLELRKDLYAVFDPGGQHLGQLKSIRSRWIFQSVGYPESGEPRQGSGPFAGCHGRAVEVPRPAALSRLLSDLAR